MKVPNVEPGGWYFEFNNEFYPDTDDTAQVLMALKQSGQSAGALPAPGGRARHRLGVRHAVQERRLGSFDKDNTKMIFQYIPFADHNAMLDPPTVDITGRMLEMLALTAIRATTSACEKAIKFILSQQEPDGSWFGRWGVNYIYGTFLVLRGLDAIGFDHLEPQIQQAAEWIRMVQNPDGGWGETCGSYDDPNTRGVGPSTPSQTAWALLGLAGRRRRPLRLDRQGRSLAADAAAGRRQLGRIDGRRQDAPEYHYRYGLPPGLLPGLHNVPPVFPADGFDQLQAGHGTGNSSC